MPPHPPHVSCAKMLANICAVLVSRFWKETHTKKTIGSLGHQLAYDKFMMPHFVWPKTIKEWSKIYNVMLPIQIRVARPRFERVPFSHITSLKKFDNMEIELRWGRWALWHVLGLKKLRVQAHSTYVDSSGKKRLQVKLSGLTDGRYVLCCNGDRVADSRHGLQRRKYVGAVRY